MYACNKNTDDIIDLMLEAHDKSTMRTCSIDMDKLRKHVEYWIFNPKCLVLVNEKVTACYILALQPSWWSNKELISDMFFYSKSPGAGIRLMKESRKWIDGFRNSITSVKITTSNSSKEVDKMYKRMGYKQTGFTYEEIV